MINPASLAKALAALSCQFPASLPEQLWQYLSLLAKWNAVHNLTAIRDRQQQLAWHLLDCLAIIPLLDEALAKRQLNTPLIADVGSGAGFPGLLWAMARPQWQLFLVESQGKKAAFLREAQRQLAVHNVQVIGKRVENWQADEIMDWVVSRAVASIDDFLRLTQHLGNLKTTWALMKAHDDEKCSIKGFVKANVEAVEVPLLDAPRLWISLQQEAKNED